jgi:hypothetical protein
MQSRQVSNFKINKMTKAQYSGIVPSQDEVYITTDEADAVLSVNGILPNAQGNVTLNIPSAVTESTVAGWGFTKNVGTVTSVNGTQPDGSGNVAITIPDISNLADKDLSNLSSTGQGILDNKLNQQQVTNCIIESPQRVNYTLSNGTVTILAGSVIVVPYGTTDLSSTYPVGATFLNSNFKVYETQYQNGKFFVYAEVQEDIVSSAATTSAAGQIRFAHIDLTNNNVFGNVKTSSGANDASGTYMFHYQDTKNILQKTDGSGNIYDRVQSLPFARIVSASDGDSGFYTWGYVLQTFNGVGYIGTAFWVDKGVKTLTPNGLNNNGSLNNIEHTQPNFSIYNFSNNISDNNKILRYVPSLERMSYENALSIYYDASTNYNRLTSNNSIPTQTAFIGRFNVANSEITSFSVNPVLNINSMCDGQWVQSNGTVVATSSGLGTGDYTYSLSSYLPDDGYNYEVIFNIVAKSASENVIQFQSSFIAPDADTRSYGQHTTNTNYTAQSLLIPIGTNRNVTVHVGTAGTNYMYIRVYAYRRIGTNS